MLRKITIIIVIALLIIGAGFSWCAYTKHHRTTSTTPTTSNTLTVNLQAPVFYVNKQGKQGRQFEAQYGSLSDNSLQFVKITTPDGKKYTLPQALSGSGARYTDDREIVWWEHHGVIRLDIRNEKGEWKEGAEELIPLSKRDAQ